MSRHRHSETTKSEILEAAKRLFLEKGWEHVNIQDIVEEVGVTRGAFYHYFKSREELVEAVFTLIFMDKNPFMHASREEGLNGLEKLRLAMKQSLKLNTNVALAIDMQKIMNSPMFLKNELSVNDKVMVPYVEKLLEEGNKDGSLSVLYPKQTAQTMVILSNIWLNPALFQVSYDEFMDKILYLEHMANFWGTPVVDNELKELLLQYYNCYMKN